MNDLASLKDEKRYYIEAYNVIQRKKSTLRRHEEILLKRIAETNSKIDRIKNSCCNEVEGEMTQ